MVRKGWCLCEMSVLGPEVGRGGNALAYDNGEAGMEKAWTASQRPCTHLEMCLMFPVSQGTKYWSLSLWLQCPQSHSCIHTRARTPMAQRQAPATFTRGDGYRCVLWVHWGGGRVQGGRCQKFQTQEVWPERKFAKTQYFRA